MKLSRSFSSLLVTIFLVCGHAAAEPAYKGDKAAFKDFTVKYLKTDWPEPEIIDYFPLGKSDLKVIRYAHWKPESDHIKGVVVHFNGRTEFIERNIYTYKDLLAHGYEVWTMDWRGQGLSQRQGNPKETGQKHTIDSFDTYLEDADYFIKNVVKINEKKTNKILLAHSMGGQIALRYLLSAEGSGVFNRAVLSSPLLRIPETFPSLGFIERPLVKYANKVKVSNLGLDLDWSHSCITNRKPDWKSDFKGSGCDLIGASSIDKSNLVNPDDTNQYSHDYTKLADINCLISSSVDNSSDPLGPDLRVACPTSLWMREAIKSTEWVFKNASELKTRTLIIRALPDAAVSNSGQDKFCTSAPKDFIKCDSISEIDGHQSGHELLIEVEPIREKFFNRFYTFIEQP